MKITDKIKEKETISNSKPKTKKNKHKKPLTQAEKNALIAELQARERQRREAEVNNRLPELTEEEKVKWRVFEETGTLDGWIREEIDLGNLANWKSKESNPWRGKKLVFKNCPNLKKIYAESRGIIGLVIENIDDAPNLEELRIKNNNLTELDVSNSEHLRIVDVSHNKLENVSLIGCENLQELYCSNNKLKELDLLDNINLEILDCAFNYELPELEIKSKSLKKLWCNNCLLSQLDCGDLDKLEFLNCSNNMLPYGWGAGLNVLILENCKSLIFLDATENNFTQLELKDLSALKTVSLNCKKIRRSEKNIKNDSLIF